MDECNRTSFREAFYQRDSLDIFSFSPRSWDRPQSMGLWMGALYAEQGIRNLIWWSLAYVSVAQLGEDLV